MNTCKECKYCVCASYWGAVPSCEQSGETINELADTCEAFEKKGE